MSAEALTIRRSPILGQEFRHLDQKEQFRSVFTDCHLELPDWRGFQWKGWSKIRRLIPPCAVTTAVGLLVSADAARPNASSSPPAEASRVVVQASAQDLANLEKFRRLVRETETRQEGLGIRGQIYPETNQAEPLEISPRIPKWTKRGLATAIGSGLVATACGEANSPGGSGGGETAVVPTGERNSVPPETQASEREGTGVGGGEMISSQEAELGEKASACTPTIRALNLEEYYQIVPWKPGEADYQIVPWKPGEAERAVEQATSAWWFLEMLYGRPTQQTCSEIILLKNANNEGGAFNLPGGKISFLLLPADYINENGKADYLLIVHELTHEQNVLYPSDGRAECFIEGLAVLSEILSTGEYVFSSGWDYDGENTPEASFLDFNSSNLEEVNKAYFMAGEAWRRWTEVSPGTIKPVNQWWREQVARGHHPTWKEIIAKFDEVSGGKFSNFVEQNYILSPSSLE